MGTNWYRFTLSVFACTFYMSLAGQINAQASNLKWGYIDKSGKLSIKAEYFSARNFQDGLAPVMVNDRASGSELWGFIDKSGKFVVEPQFEDLLPVSEGLAAARKGKWGFIDKSGKFVIEPQFDSVSSFSDGLAAASLSHLKWGFIDRSGKWKIEPEFSSACRFSENRSGVLSGDGFGSYMFRVSEDVYEVKGGFWSYIDKTGNNVIDSSFAAAGLFAQGLAPCAVGEKQGQCRPDRWGFIKADGRFAIKPQFNAVHSASEDLAAVQFGKWKSIGKGNKSWIVGKWGYIDLSGKTKIDGKFDGADRFSEGLAGVLVDKSWGFIDHKGKFLVTPQFTYCGEFHEGLACVALEADEKKE